jgi:hypothetical protein
MTRPAVVRYPAAALLFILIALVLITLVDLLAESKDDVPNSTGTSVLVELFTSEGCSDCPPADALLERLDRSQPVAGARLVVLSEHVDYWNHIGWKDPYSSHAYSERQSAYAARFGLGSVYTPQMVVDGSFEFVGSDERRAIAAAETATRAQKVSISISGAHMESASVLAVHVDAGRLPSTVAGPANVLLAVADERDKSHVTSGENGGRTLRHIAVLRSLKYVGSLDQSKGLSQDIEIEVPRRNGTMRLIAFAQDGNAGTVRGVASTSFSK